MLQGERLDLPGHGPQKGAAMLAVMWPSNPSLSRSWRIVASETAKAELRSRTRALPSS